MLKNNKKNAEQLSLALNHNHHESVDFILTKLNYTIKQINTTSKSDFTYLYWAIQKGYVKIVEVFLKHKVDVNVCNEEGNSPLHWAVENNHKEIVEVLLEHKDDVRACNKKGNSSLDIAEQNQMQKILKIFKSWKFNKRTRKWYKK